MSILSFISLCNHSLASCRDPLPLVLSSISLFALTVTHISLCLPWDCLWIFTSPLKNHDRFLSVNFSCWRKSKKSTHKNFKVKDVRTCFFSLRALNYKILGMFILQSCCIILAENSDKLLEDMTIVNTWYLETYHVLRYQVVCVLFATYTPWILSHLLYH